EHRHCILDRHGNSGPRRGAGPRPRRGRGDAPQRRPSRGRGRGRERRGEAERPGDPRRGRGAQALRPDPGGGRGRDRDTHGPRRRDPRHGHRGGRHLPQHHPHGLPGGLPRDHRVHHGGRKFRKGGHRLHGRRHDVRGRGEPGVRSRSGRHGPRPAAEGAGRRGGGRGL
ncbi:MAG: hypothetical protein AVDCRST_MAG05-3417, partial [uncultured Rubrobacteraceae bacterium]